MEKFLREWRKDALNKNQHDAAIFIGDKLLALTNSDNDAWWLAQVHFSTGNYTRAQSFLQKSDLAIRNPSCKYLAALCFIKQNKFDEALSLLGDKNPTYLFKGPGSERRKLQHVGSHLRNGSLVESKTLPRIDRAEDRDHEEEANIKAEAAMCYLRGTCYAKQNAFDKAKECYKDAVRIDVQCFEAFDALMKNSLMSPEEEWEFLGSLNYETIIVGDGTNPSLSQEAAAFTKLLYTTRLSKYGHSADFTAATEELSTHYHLGANPDISLAKASLLFTQCRFRDALALTSTILDSDLYNFATLPIHLACLHELGEKNALYLLAHSLADTHPQEPCTYLAIGIYYLTISQIASARRFFSKASILDPHFGPAWIGFAHTFAAEGEHDQAISAYSTATRLFQGTHLPNLFLGMQNLQLGNLRLAKEYLKVAYDLCKEDPLLLNELGVVFYHEEEMERAIGIFDRALEIAKEIGSEPRAWIATRANLGHALRRVGRLDDALEEFDEVLRQGGKDAAIFSAKGLVLLEQGKPKEATVALHEALATSPQDPVATDLLSRAMDAFEDVPILREEEEDEFERRIAEVTRTAGRRGNRRRREQFPFVHQGGMQGDSMVVDEEEEG
ncbi:cell division cycle protein-like protein [Tothia fuscella]|uniref:Cell division cycle protein-like protein n=1 Tax=Tothia fuscella TaxID=1048955 RepID=A0A9P4P277_9PEZI|nr:cell division cycle protein-like protein [Tothia fuscella]